MVLKKIFRNKFQSSRLNFIHQIYIDYNSKKVRTILHSSQKNI